MKALKTTAQRGFAIISAIVILVILAGLGAFALTFSTAQHVSSGQDILSVRALLAAKSGLEWGAYTKSTPAPPVVNACFIQTNVDVSTADTMAPFTVTVTCSTIADPGGRATTVTRIVSTACNEPSGGSCPNTTNPSNLYVERQVEQLF